MNDTAKHWVQYYSNLGWSEAPNSHSCPKCGRNDYLLVSTPENTAWPMPTWYCLSCSAIITEPEVDWLWDVLVTHGLLGGDPRTKTGEATG